MPNGPGIDAGVDLFNELVNAAFLAREMVEIGPYQAARYDRTDKEWPGEKLSSEAVEAVQKATRFVCQRSATEAS